jgi:hypothetical protein
MHALLIVSLLQHICNVAHQHGHLSEWQQATLLA